MSLYIKTLNVCAALLCAVYALGQSQMLDSIHIIQDSRSLNTFESTDNAATIGLSGYTQYGYASVMAKNINGNFKRPMEAERSNQLEIELGGFKKLKNWIYKTDFSYKKQYDKNVPWSGVANAYEGNPFIWADSSAGDWQRDHVKTSISLETPSIFKNILTGLKLDYQIGSGARISEPKPFYRQRYIALIPALNWIITPSKSLGFTAKINFIQEENEMGFYTNSNVLLYRLRGYGTFSKTPFVSGERKRSGQELEARIHYQFQAKKYQFLISGFASQREEEINEGVAILNPSGFYSEINYGGNVALQSGKANNGKSVSLAYRLKNGFADDVIFRAQSASFIEHSFNANVSLWHSSNLSQSLWQYTIKPEFNFIEYTDQATVTQLSAATIGTKLLANWRKSIGQNIYLHVQPFVGYSYVTYSNFINLGENIITRNLILPDYHYFSANNFQYGGEISLTLNQLNKNTVHSISLKNNTVMVLNNPTFTDRNNTSLNYLIIF